MTTAIVVHGQIHSDDLDDLRNAKELLENPGIAVRMTNLVGTPIEKGFDMLPANWRDKVADITRDALMLALETSLKTMKADKKTSFPKLHKIGATLSGGVGGAFGLPALAVELPLSTIIMLRSIADIGRAHGEDIADIETRLAFLEVFALGGPVSADDAAETGYYTVRAALAQAITEAAQYVAKKTVFDKSAPAIVRLVSIIAARFGTQVSQKVAAMAVPAIGAAGGSVINYLFIDHFQNMSRGHFTVRALERKYGAEVIQEAYQALEAPSD